MGERPVRLDYHPAGPRPTRVRYWVLGFLCALSFLSYFDRAFITRIQGDIQRDLAIDDAGMGSIFSAFWLAYALFEMPGGWAGDRWGARKALTRVVLAWSLFTALSGSAVGFGSLLCCRFLFGAGEAGAYPCMARVQARWLPARSRGLTSGLLWLVARWGAALSPVLFGTLMRGLGSPGFRAALARLPGGTTLAHLPAWRMAFWACGLVGVGWVLLFYPWFRDNPADKSSVNQAELDLIRAGRPAPRPGGTGSLTGGEPRDSRVWAALLTSPSLWGLAGVYVFGSFGFSFFVSWLPKYLLRVHKIDYAKSEWMSAMPMLCAGVASVLGGWLSDWVIRRTGRRRLGRALFPVAGHVVAAGAIFGLRYVQTAPQAVALLCVTMAAYDIGLGPKWAAIIDVGGRHAALAAGFVNMLGNLGGNFLQPIIGAKIFHRYGWDTLFGVYAATYLLAAAAWLFIRPDRTFMTELAPEPANA